MARILTNETIEVTSPEQVQFLKKTYKQPQKIKYICTSCGDTVFRQVRTLNTELLCRRCVFKATSRCLFGCDAPAQNSEIWAKQRATCIERYGTEYAAQNETVREKIKQTCLDHFGTDCSFKSREVIKKSWETKREKYTNGNYDIDKFHETFQERHGSNGSTGCPEIMEKIKRTTKDRYGNECFSKTEEWKIRTNATLREKTGYDWAAQNPESYQKLRETNLERYGVENVSQSPEFQRKRWRRYYYDGLMFDSSWEIAFYVWHKDHNISCVYNTTKCYDYVGDDGRNHKYYPDFFLEDQIIEIKGPQLCKGHRVQNGVEDSGKQAVMESLNVQILSLEEITPYMRYVARVYGKDFLKNCKRG